MSQYFLPYRSNRSNIKVELDLSNYATKTDLKNVTHVHVSSLASKTNLASQKIEVDKLDVAKLQTVPVDLAKFSDIDKNEIIKKSEYNTLVTKVNSIDTTNFEDKISKADKKIPDISDLVKKQILILKLVK